MTQVQDTRVQATKAAESNEHAGAMAETSHAAELSSLAVPQEHKLTFDQLQELAEAACRVQFNAEHREAFNAMMRECASDDNAIPLSKATALLVEAGIDAEYVRQAAEVLIPSLEARAKTVSQLNAQPTEQLMKVSATENLQSLFDEAMARHSYPGKLQLQCKSGRRRDLGDFGLALFEEHGPRFRIFGRSIGTRRTRLGYINIFGSNYDVTISGKSHSHYFSTILAEAKQVFERDFHRSKFNILYDYPTAHEVLGAKSSDASESSARD